MEKQQEYVLRTVEERGIRLVWLWFTDVLGFLKSFAVTSEELEAAFDEGIGFDGSAIEGFARVQESDMLARPDAGTFQITPTAADNAEGGVARMFCDIHSPDGRPFWGDPRFVLRRNLDKASERGFTFYVHPEMEFFVFKNAESASPIDAGGYFDLTPADATQELRRDTIAVLERLGIPVEFSHHEVSPSQHEIDLRHADALTMADSVITFRNVVKQIAAERGMYATFMPKPTTDLSGSGMHTHMSLFEGDQNAFYDSAEEYHLSKVAKAFIAGLLVHCSRDHSRNQSMGELVQATDHRARLPGAGGPRLCVLGPSQPFRVDKGSHVQAAEGPVHPHRAPFSRSGMQPISRLLADARRRPQGHRRGVRATRRSHRQHPRDERHRTSRPRDPPTAR